MKDPIRNITAFQLDVLKEISNIGAGNAATSLSKLLNKAVDMEVSRVLPMHFNEITEYVGGAEHIVATVFLRIQGDISGNMFFVISTEAARELVKDLIGQAEEEFTEMSYSVLQEIGNILSGSYLTALSDFTGLDLQPSVPSLAIDMAGALLGEGLMELGRSGDYAILIDAKIGLRETLELTVVQNGGGHFFLLPDPESFEKLFTALGVQNHGSS
ncbi:CheY-P-specific phosphatase CheC [Desulfuribacillus stibiiarsenatis]|uniref:CheY-P-specific phosphatase CheC n=1 Tax=Desulfuribacillus stibiiarsenatis TaxID=1390249 RepID=A0A1E5L6D5_9FIRM|nr:chemotaxis protein CheC [Desulfuribacillus stibiiarsenatis]OEH85608.1 CheY-P-specific phosphatase CheC [Desulfuribacillus stibiiarsenatis]